MRRWKELPDSLDQRVRQLVVQLRRLKDRSGLSLASLAAKTEYSRSSWERCLNGKALPPRHALEKLARITGTEPTRLLVLHEVAEKAWQERSAPSPSAGTEDGTGAEDGRKDGPDGREARNGQNGTRRGRAAPAGDGRRPGISRPAAAAAVAAAALAGLCAGLLLGTPLSGDRHSGAAGTALGTPTAQPSSPAPASSAGNGRGRYVFEPGKSYPCEVRRSGGRDGGALVAGYSSTRTAVLAGPGWDVVEAQCLLQHRRMDPGIVDGVYGQQTIAAVMRLQKQAGLPADGVVGPHTWQVLRG
ncbi:peptidoglycan-binding protein [Streptomyces sp. S07_1.15]|uniref:helix-turn-helix domain-containing protein n=1 Tax=Streptomyces sp. S07_1.15 TaxID=2873925 RepID=UPI001D15205D|nr:peptidoglycan-binding protein [Streptomyces sp. S07_1.15]MCC3655025.1 peptidoglycan-binding protein [Streptomyces sp. S07_1.15]